LEIGIYLKFIEWGCFCIMVHVKKLPGQSDDQVIRNFSKKVMDAGIIQEAKRRKFYLKPSLAKKLKKKMKQEEAARVKLF
jgi:ribosomal protein S21